MTTLIILLAAFIAYLVFERIELDRTRKSIPLVISVSGTRGKSTVVRLLASVLRESGRKVLAKSTGSQAQYVLPDGSVEDIRRRGIVTILEQKKLLRKAVALGADCVVAEVMSIRPENHVVESQHILKPDIVVITNVRKDHVDAMGDTVEEIGKVFQLDLHARCAAYTSVESQNHLNQEEINARSIEFNLVHPGSGAPDAGRSAVMSAGEFPENVDLVNAVARRLGIDEKTILRGIQNAVHDLGKFRIWKMQIDGKRIWVVNGFAANDPESTTKVLEKSRDIIGGTPEITGLLNLRRDRPDRSLQWIEALEGGLGGRFARIHVLGGHANVVRRRTSSAEIVTAKTPESITRAVAAGMMSEDVLFGFGNIGGPGREIVTYWQRTGVPYGV